MMLESAKMIHPVLLCSYVLILASCGGGSPHPSQIKAIPIPTNGGSTQERTMAALMRGHPKQQRKEFKYDARLAGVARAKARDMATRKYFSHINPEGYGSNWHVAKTGYRLPPQWLAFKGSNQGESLLAGEENVEPGFAAGFHPEHTGITSSLSILSIRIKPDMDSAITMTPTPHSVTTGSSSPLLPNINAKKNAFKSGHFRDLVLGSE